MFEYLRAMLVGFVTYLKETYETKVIYYPPTYLFSVAAGTMITFTLVPAFRHPYIGKVQELLPFVYAEWRDTEGKPQKALFRLNSHDLSMGSVMSQYQAFIAAAKINPTFLTEYPQEAQKLIQQYIST